MTPADGHLTYAVITAARDEADNLPRLAEALRAQSQPPAAWIIVENGSTDATAVVAEEIAEVIDWAQVTRLADAGPLERGAPIVRAFESALHLLPSEPDIIVNVDADVSMDETFFDRLLEKFAEDEALGMASGTAYEFDKGSWKPRYITGGSVWGATRAYRGQCLADVSPLERRHGWDGMDQLRARSKGWKTRVLDIPFRHHRREGERESSRWAHWTVCGESSYFMGYRFWYLLARTAHQARHDASAVAMVSGYLGSFLRRKPRWDDAAARAVLREDQRLGALRTRRREARGSE